MCPDEEVSEAPEELEIDEFLTLSETAPERKGKTTDAEVLTFIAEKAKTCSAIAKACGDVSYSAMHARLKRLLKKKKALRKYREGTAFWVKNPEYNPTAEDTAEPEAEGEEEEPET